MRRECDIDDGDGTGDLANAKNRESPGLNVETVTRGASGDSRDGRAGTRRGTAGTGGPHTRATTKHDEGDVGHRDKGGRAEHQVVNRKCLPPRRRGQAGGKK